MPIRARNSIGPCAPAGRRTGTISPAGRRATIADRLEAAGCDAAPAVIAAKPRFSTIEKAAIDNRVIKVVFFTARLLQAGPASWPNRLKSACQGPVAETGSEELQRGVKTETKSRSPRCGRAARGWAARAATAC